MMAQFGFYFDQSRCSGCNACALACKSWHNLPPGSLKYLKIYEYEKGSFPGVRIHFQWIPCYHCQEPSCLASCPFEAIYKEEKYGAVLIDDNKCTGCRICYDSCPYGAPAFEDDEIGNKVQKCNMCLDRLVIGLKPVCVLTCPTRALDFGLLDDLIQRYGNTRDLEDMPSSQNTKPAIVLKPHSKKRQIVTYNNERALELMMQRDNLPPVFTTATDVKMIPHSIIGRGSLIIKHQTGAELLRNTRNDEG